MIFFLISYSLNVTKNCLAVVLAYTDKKILFFAVYTTMLVFAT